MAEALYQFSSATEPEPELKKLKLDLRGKDEADASYTSESDDDDFGTGNLEPQHFNTEIFFKLCKAAIAYYQDKHPEELYEFESIQAVSCTIGVADGYGIVFCAKNMRINGNPLRTFNAGVAYFAQTGPDKYDIMKCAQVKDEVEEIWEEECYCRDVLLKDIKENEYTDIVHLCKLALGYYQDGHPGEQYEFLSLLKVKRGVCEGFEYKLVFSSKNLTADGNPPVTFQAYGYHIVKEAFDIWKCELLS